MEYGPCLFRIKRKGIGFVSMHVDDADGCFEFAEDGQWWAEATNDLFKTDKQPGIKLVDPGHMLGVSRTLNETEEGHREMVLNQVAYIEDMWSRFSHHRKGKRAPSTPMPGKGDDCPPALDEELRPVGVTDEEAREVHELGYRKLIGELLWPARNTSPGIVVEA